jgi:hypothetical protein
MNSQQENNQEILTIQEAKQELAEYDVALLEARSLRRLAVQTLDRSLHMARVATEQVTLARQYLSQAIVREDEANQDVRDAQIRLEQCDPRDRKSEE